VSRAVVIGAGLGGLACALRLQGMGYDVTVVEQREKPGGRAYQLKDGGFTWDTGPSLITMPWTLEETFAAGGLDFRSEIDLHPLDPYYRIHWAGDERTMDFRGEPELMQAEIAKFSEKDAKAFPGFMEALRPIYEDGILAAGRRPFQRAWDLISFTPRMVQLGAALPLSWFVAKHFESEQVRQAMSFHSLYIGGDPHRVPAIYGALVYLQFLDHVWYATGGVYSLVEAMARPLDVRCGDGAERIETEGGRVRAVVTRGGERIEADVVVSNADVLATPGLLGKRPGLNERRLKPTMSCFLLYLGTDRRFEQLHHHTLFVGDGYKDFISDVTRRGRLASTYSTYIHTPSRTEPGMAAGEGDSICVLLPVPNLRGSVDWGPAAQQRLRDDLVRDLEQTFGLEGLDRSIVVEHRMSPNEFRSELGAVDGNAFAVEPTLHQSAWLRPHNRVAGIDGLYHVGGGTHPGAGVPGVLLGAEVTAGLIAADRPARKGAVAGV
jgi:phytoene desaturase